jgi:carnitine O-acetyltransferase
MAVRTFTMPSPLSEALNVKPPTMGADHALSLTHSTSQQNGGMQEPETPQKHKGVTFASQEKLPKLPIPDIESTCQKYLESLKPLQSPREHHDTALAVHDFLKSDGPELNERLKKYATGKTSYIEQFCKPIFSHFVLRLSDTVRRVRLLLEFRQPRRTEPEPLLPSGGRPDPCPEQSSD